MPTDINGLKFSADNTQQEIFQYLIDNNMAPLHNFTVNDIHCIPSENKNIMDVNIDKYYNWEGDYITKSTPGYTPLVQSVVIGNESNITFPENIAPNIFFKSFSSPYEIRCVFNDNTDPRHDVLIQNLKAEIARAILSDKEVTPGQISIEYVNDTNIENNASIQVNYNFTSDVGVE